MLYYTPRKINEPSRNQPLLMKFLFDFFPIVLFFIAYKFYGIYTATSVAMVASIAQVSAFWLKQRRFESMHIVTLITILFLGGATLLFHNELFIKWKPTAINWTFALILLGSQFIGQKNIIQKLLEKNVTLPHKIWNRLNISWVIFLTLMGVINLYVAYSFNTDIWVNFKLFGVLGLTILFTIIQAVYLSRHVEAHENHNIS